MSFGLDLGYRRYAPIEVKNLRVYGEATAGMAFIDRINAFRKSSARYRERL